MTYETKIHSLIVKPSTEPIFSEQATVISIDDEASGVFFTIEQEGGRADSKKICFNAEQRHNNNAYKALGDWGWYANQ